MKSMILLLAGLLLAVIANINYFGSGYSARILVFLVVALILAGAYFFIRDKSRPRAKPKGKFWSSRDILAILILLIIFGPLYLGSVYSIPWQINTDEITIMEVSREISEQEFVDPLGQSSYFGFPTFIFLIFGWLSKLLGGVTLLNFRTVHAVAGILIVILAYLFFRVAVSGRLLAFGGAVILGANHSLLAISRMAMRDNTGLLIEIAALTILILGLQRKSLFYSFLGGAVAGLTFYTYYPARVTIFIWGLALLLIGVFLRKKISFARIVRIGTINLLGFLMVTAPIILAAVKAPDSLSYQREQFLIFPEGQKLEQQWTGADNPIDAIRKNIENGLGTFNNKLRDQGYIYPNYNHGFVDPLTGALIWFGLIMLFFKPRRLKNESDILSMAGFLSLWLLLAFVITKAPHYTRLLTVLPFVAYLAVQALKNISRIIAGSAKRWGRATFRLIFLTGIMIIFLWNLFIFSDFARIGLAEGNDIGSTARYVEARKDISGYTFYLAAGDNYPYYSWGNQYQWETWLGFFVGQNQKSAVVNPDFFIEDLANPPFTVFMNKDVLEISRETLENKYPNLEIHNIKTDESLLAIEVITE